MTRPKLAVLPALLLLAACARGEVIDGPRPRAARPPEVRASHIGERSWLREATDSWRVAGTEALAAALPLHPSFTETVLLPADPPGAIAYALDLHAGDQLKVEVTSAGAPLVDVVVRSQTGWEPVTSSTRGVSGLEFTAGADGRYYLRVQPEPGRGGRYTVTVRGSGIVVQFPVSGGDVAAIRSPYGDARDAGARKHDGVDIFAPRNTPVIAAADAVVEAVQNTGTGGRVIWARDAERDLLHFYAHLEKQLVSVGARIAAGDTIGLVGNSGNASGSSPHLHFGIYGPGRVPLDPTPMLQVSQPMAPPDSVQAMLGTRALTRGSGVRLRASPHGAGAILAELPVATEVQLIGAIGEWLRVRLGDGRSGFIAGRLLQAPAISTQ